MPLGDRSCVMLEAAVFDALEAIAAPQNRPHDVLQNVGPESAANRRDETIRLFKDDLLHGQCSVDLVMRRPIFKIRAMEADGDRPSSATKQHPASAAPPQNETPP